MRRLVLASALAAAALTACGGRSFELRPARGATRSYVQTFRLSERSSGGEELPDLRIERRVTITCGADGDAPRFHVEHGDVAVWAEDDGGPADFVADSASAVTDVFDDVETEAELATMYAALWATTAHSDGEVTLDPRGAVATWTGALDDVRIERGGESSEDVGGAFLESLVDDPGLLFSGRAPDGRRLLVVRLDRWSTSFDVTATTEDGDNGSVVYEYETTKSGGPFTAFRLALTGAEALDPATRLTERAAIELDVDAEVPVGDSGATRRDKAHLSYELVPASD